MADTPIFPGSIINHAIELDDANTTTIVDFVTAGSSGTRINSISATTDDDTADVALIIYYHDGADDFIIGRVNIPIGSGTDGTNPTISVLNITDLPFLADDLSYYLANGSKLRVSLVATITATKVLHLTAVCGDY